MNDLKKNINLPLLYEIRKDVFAKSRDAEYGERLFSMMHHMGLLAQIARKEGLLALVDAAKEIPQKLNFIRIYSPQFLMFAMVWKEKTS